MSQDKNKNRLQFQQVPQTSELLPLLLNQQKSSQCLVYVKEYDDKKYAIKRIDKFNRPPKYIRREMQLCEKIKNRQYRFIVNIIDVWQRNKFLYIRMKYYSSTLDQFILKNWAQLDNNWSIGISLFMQLLFALTNLKVMHRDLKPENIFVQIIDGCCHLYLSDFGECSKGQLYLQSFVGTPIYQAPQLQKYYISNDPISYSRKADIWSLGIILYQIFFGCNKLKPKSNQFLQFPWDQLINPKDGKKYKAFIPSQHEYFMISLKATIPKFIRQLIRKMIQVDPGQRISHLKIYDYLITNKDNIIDILPKEEKQKWIKLLIQYREKQLQNTRFYQRQSFYLKSIEQIYQYIYQPFQNILLKDGQNYQITQIVYYGIQQLLINRKKLLNKYQLQQYFIEEIIQNSILRKIEIFQFDLKTKLCHQQSKLKLEQQKTKEIWKQYWSHSKIKGLLMENLQKIQIDYMKFRNIYQNYVRGS